MKYVEKKGVTFMLPISQLSELGYQELSDGSIIRLSDGERLIKTGEFGIFYNIYTPIEEIEVTYVS